MPVPLIRYSQIRRTEPDTGADDLKFQRGRYFEADCLAGDVIGNWVKKTGEVAGVPQVTTVSIITEPYKPALGPIVEKSAPTKCVVQVHGETDLFAFAATDDRVFISTTGTATAVEPVPAPASFVIIQIVGMALGLDRLLLLPTLIFTKKVDC